MIPVRYYLAPQSALTILQNQCHYEFATFGSMMIGWINWSTATSNTLRSSFESQSGVIALGTIHYPLPAALTPSSASGAAQLTSSMNSTTATSVASAVTTAGISATQDNLASALDKIQSMTGGFQVHQ